MLFYIFRFLVGLGIRLWFKQIALSHQERFVKNTPILLVANHPNSALDAIVLACVLNRPLHFLARGDVFKNKFANWFLRQLNMLPVYRFSEGFENLDKNNDTFKESNRVFQKNGIILIFPEGSHSHHRGLRPLMKGAAKLAIQALENQQSNLIILPIGLHYTELIKPRMSLLINIGQSIEVSDYQEYLLQNKPKAITQLSKKIAELLSQVVLDVPAQRLEKWESNRQQIDGILLDNATNKWLIFSEKPWQLEQAFLQDFQDPFNKIKANNPFLKLLWPLALIGFLMNFIPYYFSEKLTDTKVKMPEFKATVRFVSHFVFSLIYYLVLLLILGFSVGILWAVICLTTVLCLGSLYVLIFEAA